MSAFERQACQNGHECKAPDQLSEVENERPCLVGFKIRKGFSRQLMSGLDIQSFR